MQLAWLLAQAEQSATPLEQLDPAKRAMVLMSLLALVLTGLGLIGLTMIGARWLRRVARDRKPPRDWPKPDFSDPFSANDPPADGVDSSDTIDARRRSDETQS